jgi:solute carrier family 25 carnitine/acylcarnitine transporter 20/29
VRTISFTIYSETKGFVQRSGFLLDKGKGRASDAEIVLPPYTLLSVAITSSIAGAASGGTVSLGSAPFELVKVRRQLEGTKVVTSKTDKELMAGWKAPGTWAGVKDIYARYGLKGLWTGFQLHTVRDTLGTSLYFAEYDTIRWLLGRDPRTGQQGQLPAWASKIGVREGYVAFGAGAFAGVTSW